MLSSFDEVSRLLEENGIHIGINTGIVISGTLGLNEKKDYTVMGDTVILANHL